MLSGQNTTANPISIKGDGFKGVIFPSDYKVGINLGAEYLDKRFTPIQQDIEIFENAFIEHLNSPDNAFRVSNPKQFLKRHKRQYLGYVNNKGDSVILTQFLDIGSFLSFKRRSHFSGWQSYFITCLNDFCYKYLRLYQFNLNSKKLEIA